MSATAITNNGVRNKLQTALRNVGRWYIAFCTFFITVAVLWIFYAVIHERYRYVQLPNGTRLAVTEWFTLDGGVVLKNGKGDIVVPPNIGGVTWNDQYVLGWRWVPGKDDIHFVYKIGSPAAVEFNDDTAEEFRRLQNESGLTSTVEKGYNYYSSSYQNYLDLIQNLDFHRAWYE